MTERWNYGTLIFTFLFFCTLHTFKTWMNLLNFNLNVTQLLSRVITWLQNLLEVIILLAGIITFLKVIPSQHSYSSSSGVLFPQFLVFDALLLPESTYSCNEDKLDMLVTKWAFFTTNWVQSRFYLKQLLGFKSIKTFRHSLLISHCEIKKKKNKHKPQLPSPLLMIVWKLFRWLTKWKTDGQSTK